MGLLRINQPRFEFPCNDLMQTKYCTVALVNQWACKCLELNVSKAQLGKVLTSELGVDVFPEKCNGRASTASNRRAENFISSPTNRQSGKS
jgi:hypothetical protein